MMDDERNGGFCSEIQSIADEGSANKRHRFNENRCDGLLWTSLGCILAAFFGLQLSCLLN